MINTWMAAQATINAAWIGAGATLVIGALTVVFALVGVKMQLKNDREQRAIDRRQQAAKETILSAVSGMTEASRSLAMLADPTVPSAQAYQTYAAALSKINTAGAVASLAAVRAGKKFMAVVGPIFGAANAKRFRLEEESVESQDWQDFAVAIFEFQRDQVVPLLNNAIVTIRRDLGVAHDDDYLVLEALEPDLALGQKTLNEAWQRFGLNHFATAPDFFERKSPAALSSSPEDNLTR
ncbi:hypothetical protein LN461_20200 [Xanthomonas arboricola]|uniref:hypothetical protein n=1 Tax=Xanthomonas arboricola TaxID=56448 RepID=UPI001E349F4F|nr:hypothetical protein [Xanthomonas arboricola]MCC8671655.1 hypothetical protein [Xanthomonas arboricola]